jgi:hypothetical protein
VFVAIMQHMAALAQSFQVARRIVGRIMIEVRRRQHDLGDPHSSIVVDHQAGQGTATPVAPHLALVIPPAAVAEMAYLAAMRPAAGLAAALGAPEPDGRR